MANFSQILNFVDDAFNNIESAKRIAALQLVNDARQRVHIDGKDTKGNPISSLGRTTYSKKPYFTTLDRIINKSNVPENLISKSGKSVQLPEGYESLKKFSGRPFDKIRLVQSAVLEKSYKAVITQDGFKTGYFGSNEGARLGATPAEKMAFAERRHGGTIIDPSEEELQEMERTFADALIGII